MDTKPHRYKLAVSGDKAGLKDLALVGQNKSFEVPSGEVRTLPVAVRIDPVGLHKVANQIEFIIHAEDDPSLHYSAVARFLGPVTSR